MKRDVQSPRRPWHPPLRVKRGTLYCGPRVTAPPSRSGPQMNEGVTLGDVGVTDPTRLHGACRRVRDPLLCPCGPRVTLTVRSSKEECTARSYLGCRLCGGTCLMTCTVQGTKVHPEERASCESWFLHAAGQGRYTVTTSPVAENGLGLLFGFNLRCILINAGARSLYYSWSLVSSASPIASPQLRLPLASPSPAVSPVGGPFAAKPSFAHLCPRAVAHLTNHRVYQRRLCALAIAAAVFKKPPVRAQVSTHQVATIGSDCAYGFEETRGSLEHGGGGETHGTRRVVE